VKVPGELYAAFGKVAQGEDKSIERLVLEAMRATVGRSSSLREKNEDETALIREAREVLYRWRSARWSDWFTTMRVGSVLAEMRKRAERTAGTSSGRAFGAAMNDLLRSSGWITIDKRTRSYLVMCFEHRGAITKWLDGVPRDQRPTNPRQIWRRYLADSSLDASNEEGSSGSVDLCAATIAEHRTDRSERDDASCGVFPIAALRVADAHNQASRQLFDKRYEGLNEWLTERCDWKPQLVQFTRDLWLDFRQWIRDRGGIRTPSEGIFVCRLRIEGLSRCRVGNVRGIRGIALKNRFVVEGLAFRDDGMLNEWLTERCECRPPLIEPMPGLWLDFKKWTKDRRGIHISRRAFALRLARVDGVRPYRTARMRGFCGVALKSRLTAGGGIALKGRH
jgi:hypothetical protein